MTVTLTVNHNFVCPVADDADANTVSPTHWNDGHAIGGVAQINTELAAKADKATTVTAGAGLTGGGDLSANRTLDVGAGAGISVAADAVALDTAHARNVDHTTVVLTAGAGMTGGGDTTTSRTFNVIGSTSIIVGADDVQRAALTGDVTAGQNVNGTTIANNVVTYAKMQDVTATARVLGRKTAAAGDPEECTLSEVLDFIGSAARGDVLFRGASGWARLAAGTIGNVLQTGGGAGDPSWTGPSTHQDAFAFKNIAGRNGGFEVWQRGTSITVPAATATYTCDGWYVGNSGASNCTVSRQSGLSSNSRYCARVQRDSGQTSTAAMRFAFPLDTDELKQMAGKNVVISFLAQAGTNWSPSSGLLSVSLYCGTGATPDKRNASAYTGETIPISASGVNLTPGGAAVAVVSAVGSVASNITQAELVFTWSPTGTAGANDWFQVDDFDLRVIPTGLPVAALSQTFERAPYIFDLLRCLPFYESSYPPDVKPGTTTTSFQSATVFVGTAPNGNVWGVVTYVAKKRVSPTVTFYSLAGTAGRATASDSTTEYAASSAGYGGGSEYAVPIWNLSGAGLTVTGQNIKFHFTADASI